jgi:hypothetical protein
MTKLLKKAFAEAKRLPEWEQDALAAMILDEIADSQAWQDTHDEAERLMAEMVDEALSARQTAV